MGELITMPLSWLKCPELSLLMPGAQTNKSKHQAFCELLNEITQPRFSGIVCHQICTKDLALSWLDTTVQPGVFHCGNMIVNIPPCPVMWPTTDVELKVLTHPTRYSGLVFPTPTPHCSPKPPPWLFSEQAVCHENVAFCFMFQLHKQMAIPLIFGEEIYFTAPTAYHRRDPKWLSRIWNGQHATHSHYTTTAGNTF